MMPVKRLGELLIEAGVLLESQLNDALSLQKSTGEFLGVLLVRMKWITEEQLLGALSHQFGIPRMRWDESPIDWALAGQVQQALLSEHSCFPVRMDETELTVAIVNPLDVWAVSLLETQAKNKGRKLKLLLATATEIAGAIRRQREFALRETRQSMGGGDGNAH